jgi:hypothetical protein
MQMKSPHWVIKHPDATGSVIAKFDIGGPRTVPKSIHDYDDFVIETIADKQSLAALAVDQSGLSDGEKDRLSDVYPILT